MKPTTAPVPPDASRLESPRSRYAHAVDVRGDVPAFVVPAAGGAAPRLVFLHGACTHGLGYVQAFQATARAHGGVVGVQGDRACAGTPFRVYTWDLARQHARIQAALAASASARVDVDGTDAGDATHPVVLIGYSQGAAIAEALAERFPASYAAVILIGAPSAPSPRRLARVRSAVMISGQLDVPARMRDAALALTRSGVPATYLEMPGARHGQLLDAESLMARALDWIDAHDTPHARAP